MGTGTIPLKVNRTLHLSMALAGFISASIGWLLLGEVGTPDSLSVLPALFVLFGTILPILLIASIISKKLNSLLEIFFFIGAFMTNLILSGAHSP